MELTIEIRSKPNYIYYKITGSLTLEGFIDAATRVGEVASDNGLTLVLADYRDASFDINMASVFEMPDELEALGMPIDTKSAVLYPEVKGTSEKFQMFKTLARSKAHIIRLFTEEKLALDWLLS